MNPFAPSPAAPTAAARRSCLSANDVEVICLFLLYLFVGACAFLVMNHIVEHELLTPETFVYWICVLFYVFGIGLGLLVARIRVLTDDTFSISDEEAQYSRLAQRSRRVLEGRIFILNPSVHPRHA